MKKSTPKLRVRSRKAVGFSGKAMRVQKERPKQAMGYLKQKSSFMLASFALTAFVAGNMVGQHGWYAFWKAALGQYDDSLITYTGTVPPIAFVPDYTRWSTYGGNGEAHTYRQVPKDLLIPLPVYDSRKERRTYEESDPGDVYSVGFMGSYETGAEGHGSHIGTDIRVPEGTPIRAVANGIVTRVDNDPSGFGLLIVVRHPHMPDPDRPQFETVLHAGYAHLSAQYVSEGDVVRKGQEIGLTGRTGFVTGPHLHFQLDRDEAPWYPYWPFSYSEAREAGMNTAQAVNSGLHQQRGYQYSVNPMVYLQKNYPAPSLEDGQGKTIAQESNRPMTTADRRAQRIAARGLPSNTQPLTVAQINKTIAERAAERIAAARSSSSSSSGRVELVRAPVVVETKTVADESSSVPTNEPAPVLVPRTANPVVSVDIQHDRQFSGRSWERVRITLLDASGNKTSADGLRGDLHLRTAYGEAEFKPAILTPLDFENGEAVVEMLPRGRRTVVINVEPLKSLSKPMEYVGE